MSSAAIKLGKDATLNRNTGTHGTPVLVAITNVADVTINLDKDEDDVSTRGAGGWQLSVATLKKASVDFEMNHDPADADWVVLHNMFLNDTSVEFIVLNGPNTTGAQGLRATMICPKFSAKQPLKGAQKDDVSLKPTVSANAPDWYTVP